MDSTAQYGNRRDPTNYVNKPRKTEKHPKLLSVISQNSSIKSKVFSPITVKRYYELFFSKRSSIHKQSNFNRRFSSCKTKLDIQKESKGLDSRALAMQCFFISRFVFNNSLCQTGSLRYFHYSRFVLQSTRNHQLVL